MVRDTVSIWCKTHTIEKMSNTSQTKSVKGQMIPVSYKTPAVLRIIKSLYSIVGYRKRKISI
jgi:hypothetical protein